MKLKIKKIDQNSVIPKYQTAGAAGFDLHSVEEKVIAPKEWKLIRSGLAFEIPFGYELQIRPRSGLALKNGISVLNSPGTIDSDYRGEVGVILVNHSESEFRVCVGDRIAQGVIARVDQVKFEEVDELSSTPRGDGGFGSSGIHHHKEEK